MHSVLLHINAFTRNTPPPFPINRDHLRQRRIVHRCVCGILEVVLPAYTEDHAMIPFPLNNEIKEMTRGLSSAQRCPMGEGSQFLGGTAK